MLQSCGCLMQNYIELILTSQNLLQLIQSLYHFCLSRKHT